jgi:carbon storage regulator
VRARKRLRVNSRGVVDEGNRAVLVLTRQSNQSIMIGNDVVITILEIRGDHVRIGIKAPRDVPVHREEVYAAVRQENRAAASPRADALNLLDGVMKGAAQSEPTEPPAAG